MKKLICMLLATVLLVSMLAACGADAADPMEKATSMIDASVEDVIAAIGEPNDRAYATSCIGEGEDGELYYDGFTVYTYRDLDGAEHVYDVMETIE